MRASIDVGEVTMGEVLTVLPFQNTIATFQIKGADLVTALENGVSQIDDGAGRFPQVAGLKFSFDKSKPVGGRVSDVQVKEGANFVPIDPAKTYGVVTNNYVRGGGDGFKIFATSAKNAYDYGPNLENAVAEYLTAHNPYKPYTDGRITDLTPASYTPPAKPAPAAPGSGSCCSCPDRRCPRPGSNAGTDRGGSCCPRTCRSGPHGGSSRTGCTGTEHHGCRSEARRTGDPAAPAAPAPNATAAPATAPAAPKPAGPTKYKVVKGDSLWKIAEATYGDGEKWTEIAKLNSLRHPNVIQVGAELELPAK